MDASAEVVVRAVDGVVAVVDDDVDGKEEGPVKTSDLPHHTEADPEETSPVMDSHHSCDPRLILHNLTEERIPLGRRCIALYWARPKVHRWTL